MLLFQIKTSISIRVSVISSCSNCNVVSMHRHDNKFYSDLFLMRLCQFVTLFNFFDANFNLNYVAKCDQGKQTEGDVVIFRNPSLSASLISVKCCNF